MSKYFPLIAFLFISNYTFSIDYIASSSGAFSNPTTWTGYVVPPTVLMPGDRIIIDPGITVDFIVEYTVNNGEFINNGTMNLLFDSYVNNELFINNGVIDIINPSEFYTFGTFENSISGVINNGGFFYNAVGNFENQGVVNNYNILYSCTEITNLIGNPISPELPTTWPCPDDGNPETVDYWGENCNCIHKNLNAEVYVSGIGVAFNVLQATFTPELCEIGTVNGITELSEPILACSSNPINNNFNGNIAIINRGICPFEEKIQNAEDAGASAVIICNNNPGEGLVSPRGSPTSNVTIPAVLMTYEDCLTLKLSTGNNVIIGTEVCGQPIPSLSQWGGYSSIDDHVDYRSGICQAKEFGFLKTFEIIQISFP